MKFSSIASALIFALPALAQQVHIAVPGTSATLRIGKPFTIEIDKPDSQGVTESVSVVIGLQRCGSKPCPGEDNDQVMGEILFKGDYSPVRHLGQPQKPPYQNFTFDLAATETPQHATLHVVHLFLLGAGLDALLQKTNVSVTFVKASGVKFKLG